MVKETSKDCNVTSFHGNSILTTPRTLIELFPNSYSEENTDEDIVNFEFELENSNGDVFTLWNEDGNDMDEVIEFHIGGHSQEVTEQAEMDLLEML
jgi:hypothetical protein